MKKTQKGWNSTLQQKTPLKAKKPMNKVSVKQAQQNKADALYKAKIIIEMIETKGFTYCQKCGVSVHQTQLELVHKKGKGRGGAKNDDKNRVAWCHDFHFPNGVHYNER